MKSPTESVIGSTISSGPLLACFDSFELEGGSLEDPELVIWLNVSLSDSAE